MCITVNHAKLSKTKILSLTLESGNHFIAYSNTVVNLSGKPNAMILPIPGETKPEWFHNTESYKEFLDEITDNSDFMKNYLGLISRSAKGISTLEKFELGMYSVGLSNDFDGIKQFINELPENKRPVVSEELQNFFQNKYAGWSFAICTFDSEKTIDAQPIAFEYKPFFTEFLYFPTMDGHDGKAPKIDSAVESDHTFIYEHTGSMEGELPEGRSYPYNKKFITLNAEVPMFLQNRKYRTIYQGGKVANSDTYIDLIELKKSNFSNHPTVHKSQPIAY